jgi:SPP1 gp7 family putative phage head morphogenesis protein
MKTDDKYLLEPVPNEQAIDFIKSKPAIASDVFSKLLPELRARAFTISGVENMNVLQRVRDKIAELPAGGDWNTIKQDIVKDLGPWFVDPNEDAETRDAQLAAANRRAEILLRTHGFESYQAAQHAVMKRTSEVFEYWMYQTVGDEAVREEHAALDGLILPADSPFWADHFPPWDFGCRCQVVPIMKDDIPELEDSGNGFTLSDNQRNLLENGGMLDTGDAHPVNVASPVAMGKDNAFSWNPGNLNIPLDSLEKLYKPEVWQTFMDQMRNIHLDQNGLETTAKNEYRNLYELLSGNRPMDGKAVKEFTVKSAIKDPVIHETGKFEKRVIEETGFRIPADPENGRMYGNGVYFKVSGKGKTFGAEKVEAVVNVKKPLRVKHFDIVGRESALRNRIDKDFEDVPDKAERITRFLLAHDYDAVIVTRKNETYLMVPDVRNIGVVK